MYPVMPPVLAQPQASASRDMAAALSVDSQRPLRPAREAETARAPRPVDPAAASHDMRLPTRRDKLVGPVPAFMRNMLQFLREKTMEPPRAVEPGLPEFDGAPPEMFRVDLPAAEAVPKVGDEAGGEADAKPGVVPEVAAEVTAEAETAPRPVVAQPVPERAPGYGDIVTAQQPSSQPAFDLKL